MSESLSLKVSEAGSGYEGTVTLSGLRPTKLLKGDGKTVYASRAAVTNAGAVLARRLGLTVQVPTVAANKKVTKTNTRKVTDVCQATTK